MRCHIDSAFEHATLRLSRRSFIAGLACVPALPSVSFADVRNSGSSEDERFMRIALDEARQGDFPFGAVIVQAGVVVARGHNLGRKNDDPTAHGEMVAIRR